MKKNVGPTIMKTADNRSRKGEENPLAKLTKKEVAEIRDSDVRIKDIDILAQRYGVTRGTIRNIILGYTWKP